MSQPVLVVMAAGMGSRYGGLKQIEPVGPQGQIILDYSIFDAYRAGFRKVVFIIRKELEQAFEETVGKRAHALMDVQYVYQTTDNVPKGLVVPSDRQKPLGTAHAVWCAKPAVDGAFAVINADDFYGADAFAKIYDYLKDAKDDEKMRYCMVGYNIEKTLSESGTVSRGVCTADENSMLSSIEEKMKIARCEDGIIRDGETVINDGTIVSMNLWGFTNSFFDELTSELIDFITNKLAENPLKGECYLPFVVGDLIEKGHATAKVLETKASWFGVTYKEDKSLVVEAIASMTQKGEYPAEF